MGIQFRSFFLQYVKEYNILFIGTARIVIQIFNIGSEAVNAPITQFFDKGLDRFFFYLVFGNEVRDGMPP
ncbi:MAG: hypothetical protein KA807_15060 [Prolixibacteraceae bacterium]|nr:hypothetical protein [Prolixibacteraceae bacterium]